VRTALLAALVVTSAAGAVGARPQATFRSQVTAVRLDVLVVNDGRPVAGLTSSEFEVFDNGVRQEVTAVQAESTPLDVVFALDRSQSVGGETLIRLKEAARESEVVIGGVAFVPPEDRRIDTPPPQVAFMRRLTEATGGEVVEARRGADLAPTFVRILDTMRARYLLTYTASGTNARGWHTLKVRLRHARGTVVVRPGYFGG
jgi:hypothetical protein